MEPQGHFTECLAGTPGKEDSAKKETNNKTKTIKRRNLIMEFFNSAVGVLQTLVVALGAGLGIWGAINLMEGYGNDNPGSNAHVR